MFDIDQQEESLRILRNLISIHIEKGTLDNKFLPIIIKDAQFLAEDLSDHKRLYKIDRANYSYSTYFGRNFDKDWLDQFDPENLSTEDYKKILDGINNAEKREKLRDRFHQGQGWWKALIPEFRQFFRDGQDVVATQRTMNEKMICTYRSCDNCFVRDNGEVYRYDQIESFVLI